MPLLIMNLDGVLGYWDESRVYSIKQNVLNLLFSLSMSFRIIGYTVGVRKHYVKKLVRHMASAAKPFVFDAVYVVKQTRKTE
jgi:hypothetical protein